MAGAMRKMGVYLGLVEDDDTRGGYDRYPERQGEYDRDDRGYDRGGYDRYPADHFDAEGEPVPAGADGRYGAGRFGEAGYGAAGYGAPGYDSEYGADRFADDPHTERAPEPEVSLGRRPATPRTLGLAPAPGLGSTAARLAGGNAAGGQGIAAGGPGLGGPVRSRIGGGGSAAGLAVSEALSVAPAPEPAPAPVPAPKPTPNYRITTVHPKDYNEARTIGERFRDGMPVIMNLTEMEHADAKRLVDFAIGLTFGLHGSIERVTAKVFLLSPQDVDVTAEDKARIREGGFFQQP